MGMDLNVTVLVTATQLGVLSAAPVDLAPDTFEADLVLTEEFVTVCQQAIAAADPDPMPASFPVYASLTGPAALHNPTEGDSLSVTNSGGDTFVLRVSSRVSNHSDRSEAVMAAKTEAVLDVLCAEVGDPHLATYDPVSATVR